MHPSMGWLGAVLSHTINGEEHPIAFGSQTLSRAEVNYGQVEKRHYH